MSFLGAVLVLAQLSAVTAAEQAIAKNPVSSQLRLDLGEARHEAKDFAGAATAFREAHAMGAGSHGRAAYQVAQSYAMSGKKTEALEWLARALDEGFADLVFARGDAALQSIRDEPRFRALLAAEDTTKMSRDEGWRYDIALMSREIKRLAIDPWWKTSERDFDAFVNSLSTRVPKLTDVQIELELRRIVALLGRSHSLFMNGRPGGAAFNAIPIDTYFFEEGLFVTAAHPAHAALVGSQILRIGDRGIADVLKTLDPYISQTNRYRALRIAPELLRSASTIHAIGLSKSPDAVMLTIRGRDGVERDITLNADPAIAPYGDLPPDSWTSVVQGRNREKNLWFEYDPERKLMYVAINSLRNDPKQPAAAFFDDVFREADRVDVKKFVVDLRWCNGGRTANALLFLHALMRREKLDRKGTLFVIVGRQTLSAAVNLAALLERHTNAVIAGEPTGDSPNFVGETTIVTLPFSKSRAIISDRFWQSGHPEDTRRWIDPQLYAPPTFAAARANRDPVLEMISLQP